MNMNMDAGRLRVKGQGWIQCLSSLKGFFRIARSDIKEVPDEPNDLFHSS
jgi:hypothetical protein